MNNKLSTRHENINKIDNTIINLRIARKNTEDNLEKNMYTSDIIGLEKELLRLQTEEVY